MEQAAGRRQAGEARDVLGVKGWSLEPRDEFKDKRRADREARQARGANRRKLAFLVSDNASKELRLTTILSRLLQGLGEGRGTSC